MKFIYNQKAQLNLPQFGIQIPLTDGRVTKVCDFLKLRNIHISDNFDSEIELTIDDLKRVHTDEYVAKLFGNKEELSKAVVDTFELIKEDGQYHRYDPLLASLTLDKLVEKVLFQTKGTMAAVKEALISKESFYLGGGYHHAMSFAGRGFCLINDLVVAARWSQKELGTKLIWIIDVDAHKGDGTAELTQNDSTIRTLSIHMKKGWPLDSLSHDSQGELNPWFINSDVEIGIEDGDEATYLTKLQEGLKQLAILDKDKPDLAIIVQGSDPYEKDELPSSSHLRLTKEQMLERDLLVYNFLKDKNIPQTYVMSGGYGEYAYEIYCQFLAAIL